MPYVNIKITREGVTTEQKEILIRETTAMLERVLDKNPQTTHVVIDEVDTDNWGFGGESVTFPNRMILKQGVVVVGIGGKETVEYDVAFPSAIAFVMCSNRSAEATIDGVPAVRPTPSFETSKIDVTNGDVSERTINWQAWGY